MAALTGEEPASGSLIARDYVFYSADAMSRSGEQRRINALSFMMNGEGITVATAEGFFERTMPPEVFRRSVFEIDMHSTVAPEDVEDALLRCGYSRAVQTEGPGQFSRRGGIIDFFSPAHSQPVRIEFWGDEIDSMGFFDTGTQRRTENIEKCVVVPAAEMLPSLAKGGAQALAAELNQLADRALKRRSGETGPALAAVLREDADRLSSGAELPAADRYASLIYGETTTALDYIPEDAIIVLDQPSRFAENARAYIKRVTEAVTGLTRAGKLTLQARRLLHTFRRRHAPSERYGVLYGRLLYDGPVSSRAQERDGHTGKAATQLCRQRNSGRRRYNRISESRSISCGALRRHTPGEAAGRVSKRTRN